MTTTPEPYAYSRVFKTRKGAENNRASEQAWLDKNFSAEPWEDGQGRKYSGHVYTLFVVQVDGGFQVHATHEEIEPA